ncbi:cannabinoid receptor 2-like isoform X1 [Ciona intestinalis]
MAEPEPGVFGEPEPSVEPEPPSVGFEPEPTWTWAEPEPSVEPEFPSVGLEPEPTWVGAEPEPFNRTGLPEIYAEPEALFGHSSHKVALAVFAGILGLLIIMENIILLWAIYKGKPRQLQSFNYFIANLALADLVGGFQLLWFGCFHQILDFYKPDIYILIMCSVWLASVASSIFALCHFAWHRLCIVRNHTGAPTSTRMAIAVVVLSWLLPILTLVIPPLAGWNCSGCMGMERCRKECSSVLYPFTKGYTLLVTCLLYFAIMSLFVVYGWIYMAVHRKLQRVKNKGMQRREVSMIRTTLIILALFTLSMLPVAVLLTIDYVTMEYNPQLIVAFQIATVVSFINSLCNPLLYARRLPSMREAAWRSIGLGGSDSRGGGSEGRKSGLLS